ncbi:hypothetical protein AB4059_12315 [Lysobacter sp. 2RAF19]
MTSPRKIVLHSTLGYRPELNTLIASWIREGVKYVGVVGVEAARIEDAIDDLCIGDGATPYFMLTASHGADETLDDAVFLAERLSEELGGPVTVVEF